MKNKLSVWKQALIMLLSGVLFFAVSYPFTLINSYFVITEVRLSAMLNPCIGFVFGPAGAVGCALGNFVCDIMTMEFRIAVKSFPFQVLYGLIPWLLLKLFPFEKDEKEYYRFRKGKNVILFYSSVTAACLFIASCLGLFFSSEGEGRQLFVFIFANNIAVNFIFDIPFVLLSVHIKRKLNKMSEILNVSIGETLQIFFMLVECAAVLLVCLISYFQLKDYLSDVALWDRIFYGGVATVILFAVIQILFTEFIEKRIINPLNSLAGVWQKDRKLAVEMCNYLYHNRSEIGELSRAYLELVDEIQINVMKLSKAKTSNNGIGDVVVCGERAEMTFSGSLEGNEVKDLAINLTQIPKSCRYLEINTQTMTFMTGDILGKISEFIEKRKNIRVAMSHVSDSTKMILNITGFIDLIEIV